jgi:hypothetical protein
MKSTEGLQPGMRVRLHSGRDTGTVTDVTKDGQRCAVRWDTGRHAAWSVKNLVILADEPDPARSRFTGDERDETVTRVRMPSERCVWTRVGLAACDPDAPGSDFIACRYCREEWGV